MIDASAVLELLLGTDRAERLAKRALAADEHLHAPHLIDVEIAQVMRRLVRLRDVPPRRAQEALEDYAALVIERYPHHAMLQRIWALRSSLTAYDAAYVALAEALDAPLLTCDRKLNGAHGHRATIELVN